MLTIEKENINIETIIKDAKLYSEYVKKEHSFKVDFNKLEDAIYYVRVSPTRIIPLGFYSLTDVDRFINKFYNIKRITGKVKTQMELFLGQQNIQTIDYLTANDLLYHNKGNWIKEN